MTLTTPINFGHRTCDRVFIRALSAFTLEREAMLWKMYLVWKDFGTAREDRRLVPRDPEARSVSTAVAVLEEFVGWQDKPGEFIRAGIESGFFMLTPVTEDEAELILVDFFPANASASIVSNSEAGGISKSLRGAKLRAEAAASDQLQLFKSAGGITVQGATDKQIKSAVVLVHSICQILRYPTPADDVWRQTVLAKAVEVITHTDDSDRECVFRWFTKNRGHQRIPKRIDFLLDQFASFIPEAQQTFRK